MPEEYDQEVNAIKAILKALEALSPDARASVIEYVTKRLGVSTGASYTLMNVGSQSGRLEPNESPQQLSTTATVHIKDFKQQKNPRSANEMAALVAYYLAELAPLDKRKKRINATDIQTYFKIAEYPLPEVRFTLPNAKAAGYFNAAGEGEYELNAVGHNLVAHSLPRKPGTGTRTAHAKKGTRRPPKHR